MKHQLCDWAYLMMLRELGWAFFGQGSNEACLLTAFIYCQSGYQVRLGMSAERLYLLYASEHVIFNVPYFSISGVRFYPLDSTERQISISEVAFPGERPLSLYVSDEQMFDMQKADSRELASNRYPEMKASVTVNRNQISFYDTYPTSEYGGNVLSRWAMYANTPMAQVVREELYPRFTEKFKGLSELEKVERLLNWVQTAFVYEYDDKVWGHDRAFFAEESLFYPYCDCEDRSILFSRLVRDLLGLKVILVLYPGHLATAVQFSEDVKGDYILMGSRRFVVCDPTYINAPVGWTMPDMDNASAKVILLN